MVKLKSAEYKRRDGQGNRVVEVVLYADSLNNLPTSATDIDGLLPNDVLDAGSIAVDMTTGKTSMYDGSTWNNWA